MGRDENGVYKVYLPQLSDYNRSNVYVLVVSERDNNDVVAFLLWIFTIMDTS